MSWLLLLAPVLLVFGLFLRRKVVRYRGLLKPDHVRELLLGFGPLGAAALNEVGTAIETTDDPRVLGSSQGLVFTYTTERRNEVFVHRLTLVHLGGVTTFSVARRFLALALTIFDPDAEADRVMMTPERLFYVEWIVGQERQDALNQRGFVLPPGQTDDDARAVLDAAEARLATLGQALAGPQGSP